MAYLLFYLTSNFKSYTIYNRCRALLRKSLTVVRVKRFTNRIKTKSIICHTIDQFYLLFPSYIISDLNFLIEVAVGIADAQPRSIRDFVETLIDRQAKIINAAIQSQTAVNAANLRKRYQTYSRAPKLRQRIETTTDDHTRTTTPLSIANIIAIKLTPKPPLYPQRSGFNHGIPRRGNWNILN